MLKLVKNGEIYSPKYLGKKDILLIADKIGYIDDCINIPDNFVDIEVIDAEGSIVTPGFIDGHVHITGGGGEGGFKTRTPEIQLFRYYNRWGHYSCRSSRNRWNY